MRILIKIILLLSSISAYAQQDVLTHFNTSNGLLTNEVYNIHQDSKGYIWIADDKGLAKYNGTQFIRYYNKQMIEKAGSLLKEDAQGRIWYTTFGGSIYYVENDSLINFISGNQTSIPSEFFIKGDTIIILRNSKVVESYSIKQNKLIAKKYFNNNFSNILQNGQNLELISLKELITLNTRLERVDSTFPTNAKTAAIKNFEYLGHTFTIQFLDFKLEIINKQTGKAFYIHPSPMVFQGSKVIDSNLYILNRQGLLQINLNSQKSNFLFKGISTSDIIKDKAGYIWITSTTDGIFLLNKQNNIDNYKLPIKDFKCKIINNTVFVLDAQGGVFEWLNNKLLPILQLPSNAKIYDIVSVPKAAKKFVPTYGLLDFKYKGHQYVLGISATKGINILDNKYMALATSSYGGLYKYNNTDEYSIWDKIFMDYQSKVDRTLIDNKNIIWFKNDVRYNSVSLDSTHSAIYFSSSAGIDILTPEKYEAFKFKNQDLYIAKLLNYKSNNYFLSITGNLYINSNTNDITECNKINANGPFEWIAVIHDKLILYSSNGFFYVPLSAKLNAQSTCNIWNKSNNKLLYNGIIQQDSNIYAYAEGLIEKKSTLQASNYSFPIIIEDVQLESGKKYFGPKIELAGKVKNIILNFSVLDFHSNLYSLKYKVGNDNWTNLPVNSRSISFANLSPGNYPIQICANNTIYSNSLTLQISTPWFRNLWFWLSVALVSLVGLYFLFKYRLSLQNKRSNLLLEKAQLETQLRNSMLSSIKSQMNPHFLFNALNTLQSLIYSENKHSAAHFLSKFSKLTRKILDMSEAETISLEEEINIIELYLDIEDQRFDNFEYTINIDPALNVKQLQIPSMIVQPYIENSIKHGLLHKRDNKKIDIAFNKKQYLEIIVDDNGIGRTKSAAINQHKKEHHQSFATNANKKRIELLKKENPDIKIEFIDKLDKLNNSLGTTVIIHLPLLL